MARRHFGVSRRRPVILASWMSASPAARACGDPCSSTRGRAAWQPGPSGAVRPLAVRLSRKRAGLPASPAGIPVLPGLAAGQPAADRPDAWPRPFTPPSPHHRQAPQQKVSDLPCARHPAHPGQVPAAARTARRAQRPRRRTAERPTSSPAIPSKAGACSATASCSSRTPASCCRTACPSPRTGPPTSLRPAAGAAAGRTDRGDG